MAAIYNSENLSMRYSTMTDDGDFAMSAKERNIDILLSKAEEKYDNGQLTIPLAREEIVQMALQARAQCRSGDELFVRGSTDATRLAVQILISTVEEDGKNGTDRISRAEKLAAQELGDARSASDPYGQAAMLLCIAEINTVRPGKGKLKKAIMAAKESHDLAQQGRVYGSKGKLMRALAQLQLSRIYCKQGDHRQATECANQALLLGQGVSTPRKPNLLVQAQANDELSVASMLCNNLPKAIKHKQLCIKLLKDLVPSQIYAKQLLALAKLVLQYGEAQSALVFAKEANTIFHDLGFGRGWEGRALRSVVDCYIAMDQNNKAQRLAKVGMSAFRQRGENPELYQAMMAFSAARQAEGDFAEGATVLEEALSLCRQKMDRLWEANILAALAAAWEKSGDYEKALAIAEQLSELYHSSGESSKEVYTLVHTVTKLQIHADLVKEAAATSDRARDLAEKGEDSNCQAWACLASFAAHIQLQDLDIALRAAQEARELFEEDGDKKGETKALRSISCCFCAAEKYRLAVRTTEDELSIQKELGDKMAAGSAMLAIAEIHTMDHKPKDVINISRDALNLFSAEGAAVESVRAHLNIAQAYDELLKNLSAQEANGVQFNELFMKGVKSAKEAMRIANEIGDQQLQASALYWSGSLYAVVGKSQDAIQAAMEAQSLCKQIQDRKGEVRAQALLGQAMILKQNLQKAKAILQVALALAEEIEDDQAVKMITELLLETQPRQVQQVAQAVSQATAQQDASGKVAADTPAAAGTLAGTVAAFVAPDGQVISERIVSLVQDMTGETGVAADQPFMDTGIDSLASVELRTNLQKAFGVQLPSTVMFNYPTTSAMADFLVSEMTANEVSLK